jgi:hypothetical protein
VAHHFGHDQHTCMLQAKVKENQRRLEEERRERERAARGSVEPPEPPPDSGATSSQEGDDAEGELGRGLEVLEGSGASREEMDGEEMARWRAAEEAAAARKAKEKGEQSFWLVGDLQGVFEVPLLFAANDGDLVVENGDPS